MTFMSHGTVPKFGLNAQSAQEHFGTLNIMLNGCKQDI